MSRAREAREAPPPSAITKHYIRVPFRHIGRIRLQSSLSEVVKLCYNVETLIVDNSSKKRRSDTIATAKQHTIDARIVWKRRIHRMTRNYFRESEKS